ncbi:hypothetical protein J7E96_18315 [Streptomyces sp. ISL-96]|uniref:hypothetical protein n=1 Tax=Streptomyces sp. ISL-96 TaxID=2819191 RepID=UPI001BEA5AC2|nr:hypothetical protein [Streptomyces sp. ISL-96]MBT2490437.1 hypothetical protein [Streptomyces sp. ISL-96]
MDIKPVEAHEPPYYAVVFTSVRREEGAGVWQRNAEHRAVQKQGRAEWYENYTVHVAKVERSYGFERG